jgi:hypothetical protein
MKALFLAAVLLIRLQTYSQYSLQTLFPMGVSGIEFGDTLLNTSAILKREGIRKIFSYESSRQPIKRMQSKTYYLNEEGKIQSSSSCFRNLNNDSGFCLTDTIIYDAKGRIKEMQVKDGGGFTFLTFLPQYINERETKYLTIASLPDRVDKDSSIYHEYFDEKGRVEQHISEGKKYILVNAKLFYNNEGFLDSIVHEHTQWGTYVFKRKFKKSNIEIALETTGVRFQWIYNHSGQCLSTSWAVKNRSYQAGNSFRKYTSEMNANYFYNSNGTLSKVVENRNGKKITTIYSYSR